MLSRLKTKSPLKTKTFSINVEKGPQYLGAFLMDFFETSHFCLAVVEMVYSHPTVRCQIINEVMIVNIAPTTLTNRGCRKNAKNNRPQVAKIDRTFSQKGSRPSVIHQTSSFLVHQRLIGPVTQNKKLLISASKPALFLIKTSETTIAIEVSSN